MNGHSESSKNQINYEHGTKPTAIVTPSTPNNYDDSAFLPNRLLAAIPVSDLGDSLDSRHLSESLNLSHGFGLSFKMEGLDKDGLGLNSDDSGYDEYEEEYSYIITEHSAPELVAMVEKDFKLVSMLSFSFKYDHLTQDRLTTWFKNLWKNPFGFLDSREKTDRQTGSIF